MRTSFGPGQGNRSCAGRQGSARITGEIWPTAALPLIDPGIICGSEPRPGVRGGLLVRLGSNRHSRIDVLFADQEASAGTGPVQPASGEAHEGQEAANTRCRRGVVGWSVGPLVLVRAVTTGMHRPDQPDRHPRGSTGRAGRKGQLLGLAVENGRDGRAKPLYTNEETKKSSEGSPCSESFTLLLARSPLR